MNQKFKKKAAKNAAVLFTQKNMLLKLQYNYPGTVHSDS